MEVLDRCDVVAYHFQRGLGIWLRWQLPLPLQLQQMLHYAAAAAAVAVGEAAAVVGKCSASSVSC